MIASASYNMQFEASQCKTAMNCKPKAESLLISNIQLCYHGLYIIAQGSDPFGIIQVGEDSQAAISAILKDLSSFWRNQLIELLKVIVQSTGNDLYTITPLGMGKLGSFGEVTNIQKENGSRKLLA